MDQERVLKRVWLINGVLLVVLLGALAVWLTYSLVSDWLRREPRIATTRDDAPRRGEARAIRYDAPKAIWKSTTRIVLIRYGEAFERPSPELGSGYSYTDRYTPYVNVIFLEPGDGPGRLLLDRPAFIRTVDFPRSKDDSLQSWITYEIALEDTDRDGGLDEDDAVSLYVSDLHGGAFHRVLPEGWSVFEQQPLRDGRHILVLAVRSATSEGRRSREQAPERAFLYDVQTSRSEPYAMLDSLATRAGRIVGL